MSDFQLKNALMRLIALFPFQTNGMYIQVNDGTIEYSHKK